MAEYRTESGKYITATTLAVSGYGLKEGTNYKEVALATAVSDIPVGVTLQSCVQNDNIGYAKPGQTVKAVAGAAVVKGVLLTVTTGGKFITAVKTATPGTVEFVWGKAHSAAGADLDICELDFNWFDMDIA